MISRIEIYIHRVDDHYVAHLTQWDADAHPARLDTRAKEKRIGRYRWAMPVGLEDEGLGEALRAVFSRLWG